MKIVVSGGTGFIGRALVARLGSDAHDVVLLSRNPAALYSRLGARVKVEAWDGRSLGPWTTYVDGADAVINFAGEPLDAKRWSRNQKERIVSSRVNATHALVHAMQAAREKPSVFLSASGVGYYGPVEQGKSTEESPRGSDFLSEVTFQWERAAQEASASGIRTVALRVAVVLGNDGGALRKMLIPFKLFVGGPLGSGRQWFPWIHRDDLVETITFTLSNAKASGPMNVVAPESVTMREFCATLGRVLKRPSWAPVPSIVLKAMLGEMSEMVLTGQRPIPRKLEELGYRFKFSKLEEALSQILQ